MSFNLVNLRSDARYLVFGDSTNTVYGDTDLDRNINRWYNTVIAWILTANGDWQVNGEIATTNLVSGQREYLLPTDILKLNEVYIKPVSTGNYLKSKQKDLANIATDNDTYVPSYPQFDLLDNSIFIYTQDGVINTVTAGLKVIYQKDLTELTGTSAPNLAEPFKRLLSIGAAFDYCIANEMYSKAKGLKVIMDETKTELLGFYADRSTARDIKLEPKEENLY